MASLYKEMANSLFESNRTEISVSKKTLMEE
jgi:hypothetical protein